MRVLGVDPGLGRCGWAVLERRGGRVAAVGRGTIHTGGAEGGASSRSGRAGDQAAAGPRPPAGPGRWPSSGCSSTPTSARPLTVGQASWGGAAAGRRARPRPSPLYTRRRSSRRSPGRGDRAKERSRLPWSRRCSAWRSVPAPADTADALAVALCTTSTTPARPAPAKPGLARRRRQHRGPTGWPGPPRPRRGCPGRAAAGDRQPARAAAGGPGRRGHDPRSARVG